MPRPKTKEELLNLSKENFETLNDFIDALSEEERNALFPEGTLNRNVRDVLAHLHHWHLMMCGWYDVGMKGEKPDMPAEGYTWKTVPALNRAIQQQYSEADLADVRALLDKSFKDVRKIIATHSDEELFEKKHYPWTGSTSLGAYLVSATSSHYDWALKLIRKAIGSRGAR